MKQLILQKKVNLQIILSFGKMKIDKEKFNKLKQLDRIEFRQKLNYINEYFGGFSVFGFINFSMIIMGFLLLLVLSSYNISKELFVSALNLIQPTLQLLLFGIFIILLLDIVSFILKIKRLRELEEEYFSVEVKK